MFVQIPKEKSNRIIGHDNKNWMWALLEVRMDRGQ